MIKYRATQRKSEYIHNPKKTHQPQQKCLGPADTLWIWPPLCSPSHQSPPTLRRVVPIWDHSDSKLEEIRGGWDRGWGVPYQSELLGTIFPRTPLKKRQNASLGRQGAWRSCHTKTEQPTCSPQWPVEFQYATCSKEPSNAFGQHTSEDLVVMWLRNRIYLVPIQEKKREKMTVSRHHPRTEDTEEEE